jgi:peptide/nickel transport system permease protein
MAQRLALLVVTLLGISILVFLFIRLIPGDVIDVRVGTTTGLTPKQLEALREYYGLDKPFAVQYVNWLGSLVRGDLGLSIRSGRPVSSEILSRYPTTLELTLAATLVALVIGLPVGVVSALRRDGVVDLAGRFLALMGLSLPRFWTGTLIILVLSRAARWMPNAAGYVSFTDDPLTNLKQIFFPAVTLGAGMAAAVMRQTRSSMLDVLGQDYVRTAYAKGLSQYVVLVRHCLKNALIVVLTIVGIQIGYLLGGAVVVEEVFVLPGIGRMMLNAVEQRDYAVVQGAALVIALNFVFINLIVDVAYALVDPRIRLESTKD